MTEHTVRSFSQDLEELTGDLARMGGLAEDMLSDAIQAIAMRDLALAETVVARHPQIVLRLDEFGGFQRGQGCARFHCLAQSRYDARNTSGIRRDHRGGAVGVDADFPVGD